jgi:hypothetical protein
MPTLPYHPAHLAAGAAGLLLVAAAINAALSQPVAATTPRIVYQGDPLVRLKATMPTIGAFGDFNVNDDNPFIPWHERDLQRALIGNQRNGKAPPERAVVRTPTKPPPLVYPRLVPGGTAPPAAIGLIGFGEHAVLLIRNGDDATSVPVPLGGSANGWILADIEDNNRAVWRNADGLTVALPIGQGTLGQNPPAADSKAATPKTDAPKTDAKRGEDKKGDAKKPTDSKDGKKGTIPRRPRFTDPPASPDKM